MTDRYELASGDSWVISDARAVTKWFNDQVSKLNSGQADELKSGQADGSQMRRITKLTKKFARRAEWKAYTTSGITITKLIVDHFVANADREDKALRQTWQQIHLALSCSTQVAHPIVAKNLAEQGDAEVTYFRDCLKEALDTLEVLDREDCTRVMACKAWDSVFDTCFFSNQPDPGTANKASDSGIAMSVTSVETARRVDGGGRFG